MGDFFTSLFGAIIDMVANNGATAADLTIDSLALGTITEVCAYFFTLGMIMTIVYFLLDINNIVWMEGRGNVDIKTLIKPFFLLVAAIAFMINSGYIISGCIGLYNGMIDRAVGWANNITLNSGTLDFAAVEDFASLLWDTVGFLTGIFLVLVLLIYYLVSLVVKLVFMYKAWVYKFKILMRVAFMPIAFADIYNLQHSTAMKYLKGTLAIGIGVIGLILIPRIGAEMFLATMLGNLNAGSTMGFLGSLAGILCVPIASIGVLGVVEQYAREALGS